ncbi:MAG: hypothetical protein EXS46_02075 [Candidatus Taylorbacteria bacterium]|nr:hypothetical protein [Candidatus Taylorbacteria bacterium]
MATVKRQTPHQSIISFSDFDIRLFVKYQNGLANKIRVWKLHKDSSFLQMFNTKNLIWAIYNQDAKYLHGWFFKEGDFSQVLTKKIANCSSFEELQQQLIELENIIRGELPNNLEV